jgi:hypothetical protein
MSVLYFFAMFVMFFPKGAGTALAPPQGARTGVVEVVL